MHAATAQPVEDSLELEDRELVRALRKAAKITAAAALPAEHRPAAFRAIAELELRRALAERAGTDG